MTKEDIKPNTKEYHEAQKKSGAQIRKKTLFDKAAEAFSPQDRQSVGEFLIKEVLIPNIKDLAFSMVTNGLSMWLWDDTRRVGGTRPTPGMHTNYAGISKQSRPSEQNTRSAQRVTTASIYNLTEDITYDNMAMARSVLEELMLIITTQGFVTVGDMYEIADKVTYQYSGIHLEYSVPFTAHSYGWYDLSMIRPKNIRGRWILPYPDPVAIAKK